jgi:hypothetical protein
LKDGTGTAFDRFVTEPPVILVCGGSYFVEDGTRKARGEGQAGRERYDVSAKYHPGEIEVQERAGVRSMAEPVGNSIRPITPPATREFLEEQLTIVVGSVGTNG